MYKFFFRLNKILYQSGFTSEEGVNGKPAFIHAFQK